MEASPGPYADEAKHMGGFWVIEAAEEQEAQGWAERPCAAVEGPVELRPLQGAEG